MIIACLALATANDPNTILEETDAVVPDETLYLDDDLAEAHQKIKEMTSAGANDKDCRKLVTETRKTVQTDVDTCQKTLNAMPNGDHCMNVGQAVVKSATEAKSKADKHVTYYHTKVTKAASASVAFGSRTFSSLTEGKCSSFYTSAAFTTAEATHKAAVTAHTKAKGAAAEAATALKNAIAAAAKAKHECLCKTRIDHKKAFATHSAADAANQKAWNFACKVECVLDRKAKCTCSAAPKCHPAKLSAAVAAEAGKCEAAIAAKKKAAEAKAAAEAAKKKAAEEAAKKKAAEEAKKKAAEEAKKRAQQAADGLAAEKKTKSNEKAQKAAAKAAATPKDCTFNKDAKCWQNSQYFPVEKIPDWPRLRKNDKGSLQGKKCSGSYSMWDRQCSCQHFCQTNPKCAAFEVTIHRGAATCTLMSRKCQLKKASDTRGDSMGVCGGAKNHAKNTALIHKGPCGVGFSQVGTKTQNNDVHGKCLGQLCGHSNDSCAAACKAKSGCVSYMFGRPAQLGHCAGLCELCDKKAPNNSWGSDLMFCSKN